MHQLIVLGIGLIGLGVLLDSGKHDKCSDDRGDKHSKITEDTPTNDKPATSAISDSVRDSDSDSATT